MSSQMTPEELAQLPHDDRGPQILAIHWTLTAFATIFLGLRIYAKHLTGRNLWWDDWVLIAAWVRRQPSSYIIKQLIESLPGYPSCHRRYNHQHDRRKRAGPSWLGPPNSRPGHIP